MAFFVITQLYPRINFKKIIQLNIKKLIKTKISSSSVKNLLIILPPIFHQVLFPGLLVFNAITARFYDPFY